MHEYNKAIGSIGELYAIEYLKNLDYKLMDRNFRSRFGEIDIIARDGIYIVFIEVKTRYNSVYGLPCESVNYNKMSKLKKTAEYYILKNKLHKNYFRFDVIEIYLDYNDNLYSAKLIKNAF